MTQLIDDIHFRLPVFECISIIIPSLHTKNSARRHTIPMKLLWHLADMPTMFGKSWRSIVPLAFCTMRIFVIPRVRSVVCYQLCCTAIPCMCTGIASLMYSRISYNVQPFQDSIVEDVSEQEQTIENIYYLCFEY